MMIDLSMSQHSLLRNVGLGVGSYEGLAVALTGADDGELVGMAATMHERRKEIRLGVR
jgi:hypothetical protein